jgi:2-polyprenyl-3-methyl-5-hydroxy-6-metoxy-1,4-benzoquinol methylase
MKNAGQSESLLTSPDATPRCHVCGGSQSHKKFSVPLLRVLHPYNNEVKYRAIYQCDSCSHLFAESFDALGFANYYQSLSADCHGSIHDTDQFRYRQVLSVIAERAACRVLDIGCGTGTFLAMLGPEVERFGIEPTLAAADIARNRGVTIIQPEDLDRPDLRNSFDVVTSMDVLEHATDLDEFRRQLVTALRPGGRAILLTGDADSESAKRLGPYWYYMHGAEHITFFSSRSIRTWLNQEFHRVELTKTSHNTARREWAYVLRLWLLFPVKWVLSKLFAAHWNRHVALYLPGDHMLVCATRNGLPTGEPALAANGAVHQT